MDKISKEMRSWNMSRIRSKDTKPEKVVRSILHRMGYRFRLHVRTLPGTPDIVLPKYNTVIFVHGCFWHRHSGCKYTYEPKSRKEFWDEKFRQNVKRHRDAAQQLQELGWQVLTVWECQTAKITELREILSKELWKYSSQHSKQESSLKTYRYAQEGRIKCYKQLQLKA